MFRAQHTIRPVHDYFEFGIAEREFNSEINWIAKKLLTYLDRVAYSRAANSHRCLATEKSRKQRLGPSGVTWVWPVQERVSRRHADDRSKWLRKDVTPSEPSPGWLVFGRDCRLRTVSFGIRLISRQMDIRENGTQQKALNHPSPFIESVVKGHAANARVISTMRLVDKVGMQINDTRLYTSGGPRKIYASRAQ